MEIKRAGSQPSGKGPSEWFTGTVRIDPLFQAPDPALVQGASVTFEPGARTAWHTHPLGQTLIVIPGCGWARPWGGPIAGTRPRDGPPGRVRVERREAVTPGGRGIRYTVVQKCASDQLDPEHFARCGGCIEC